MADLQYDVMVQVMGEQSARAMVSIMEGLGIKLQDVKEDVKEFNGELRSLYSIKAKNLTHGQRARTQMVAESWMTGDNATVKGFSGTDTMAGVKEELQARKDINKQISEQNALFNNGPMREVEERRSAWRDFYAEQEKSQQNFYKEADRLYDKNLREQEREHKRSEKAKDNQYLKDLRFINGLEDKRYKEIERQEKAQADDAAKELLKQVKAKQDAMKKMYADADKAKENRRAAGFQDAQFGLTEHQFAGRHANATNLLNHDASGEARRNLDASTLAFRKAQAANAEYIAARTRGDRQAAASYAWFRNKYVAEANAMARAAEQSAHRQERANRVIQQSYMATIRTMNTMRYALYSIGTMVGVGAIWNLGERLAHGMTDAFKASVNFNDEMTRAEATFTAMGISNLGGRAMHTIKASGTPAEKAQLAMSEKFGKDSVAMARKMAALTGQDIGEVFEVMRQAIPDWMNKLKGKSGKGAIGLLNNQDMFVGDNSITKKIVELSAVLKTLDPGKHRMKWQATALMEMFTGTLGSTGKGAGADAFKSARTRLGIFATPEEMKAITTAANSGDLRKAVTEIESLLARSGVTKGILEDMLRNSAFANLDAIKSNLLFVGGLFTGPVYRSMGAFFSKLRIYTTQLNEYEPFKKFIYDLGVQFSNFAKQEYFDKIATFIKRLEGDGGQTIIDRMVQDMRDLGGIMQGLITNAAVFAEAFAGVGSDANTTAIANVKIGIESLVPVSKELGTAMRLVVEGITAIGPAIEGITPVLGPFLAMLRNMADLTKVIGEGLGEYYNGDPNGGNISESERLKEMEQQVRKAAEIRRRKKATEDAQFIGPKPLPKPVKTSSAGGNIFHVANVIVHGAKDLANKIANGAAGQAGSEHATAVLGAAT